MECVPLLLHRYYSSFQGVRFTAQDYRLPEVYRPTGTHTEVQVQNLAGNDKNNQIYCHFSIAKYILYSQLFMDYKKNSGGKNFVWEIEAFVKLINIGI